MSACGCKRNEYACSEAHAVAMSVVYCGDCLRPVNECGHGGKR